MTCKWDKTKTVTRKATATLKTIQEAVDSRTKEVRCNFLIMCGIDLE